MTCFGTHTHTHSCAHTMVLYSTHRIHGTFQHLEEIFPSTNDTTILNQGPILNQGSPLCETLNINSTAFDIAQQDNTYQGLYRKKGEAHTQFVQY